MFAIIMTYRNFYNSTRTRANKYARARYYNKFHFCKVDFAKLNIFAFYLKKICIYQKKAIPLHRELIQSCINTFYILTNMYNSQIKLFINNKTHAIMKNFMLILDGKTIGLYKSLKRALNAFDQKLLKKKDEQYLELYSRTNGLIKESY